MNLSSIAPFAMLGRRRDGGDGPAARSRHRRTARLAVAGCVGAALVAAVAAGPGAGAPAGRSTTSVTGGAQPAGIRLTAASIPVGQDPSFPISGSVQGLAPGVRSQLALTISNPFQFAIRVVALTVEVGDAPGPCVGKDLEIQPFRGPVQIPAGKTATTRLEVTLSDRSPDVCQAAAWPLTYRGQAVQVSASGGSGSGAALSGGGQTGSSAGIPGQTGTGSGPGSSAGALPVTGAAVSILITAAVVLLVGGTALLLAPRRRRRSGAARRSEDSRAP